MRLLDAPSVISENAALINKKTTGLVSRWILLRPSRLRTIVFSIRSVSSESYLRCPSQHDDFPSGCRIQDSGCRGTHDTVALTRS